MQFKDKEEARKFLKNSKDNNLTISQDEEKELLKYFTKEEIKNSIFFEWKFNDCLKNGIDAQPSQPHICK